MKKILFIIGTRPEAIKLAPLYLYFKTSHKFEVKICITAQHRQMLDEILSFFKIIPDYDLNLMKQNQTLFDITNQCIQKIEPVIDEFEPNLIFVQGDTTTAFIGALAGFYKKIKIAHIEAGLRSFDKYSPFPEEINRKLISHIADFHFCPTEIAVKNLMDENIVNNVFNVGNTVIDALFYGLKIISKNSENEFYFSTIICPFDCPNLINDIYFDKIRDIYEIKFVHAACWLISKECLKEVGGFDPIFPHYCEDNDYLMRAKYFNFKIGICPKCFVMHKGTHQSLKKLNNNFQLKLNYVFLHLKNINFKLSGLFLTNFKMINDKITSSILYRRFSDFKINFKLLFYSFIKISQIKKSRRLTKQKTAFLR